jgi:hypothetical protein
MKVFFKHTLQLRIEQLEQENRKLTEKYCDHMTKKFRSIVAYPFHQEYYYICLARGEIQNLTDQLLTVSQEKMYFEKRLLEANETIKKLKKQNDTTQDNINP